MTKNNKVYSLANEVAQYVSICSGRDYTPSRFLGYVEELADDMTTQNIRLCKTIKLLVSYNTKQGNYLALQLLNYMEEK